MKNTNKNTMNNQIQLGDRVRDVISKYQGIVTGRYAYLNGCVRLAVAAEKCKDGKVEEAPVFDEPQLRLLKRGVIAVGVQPTGGPRKAPAAMSAPKPLQP